MRIGQGFDVHAFAAGRRLMLGGVEIPHPTGLAGHSDADVLLHAIIDALLGAAGLGDIGRMFPSADPRWAGADSTKLLEHAFARVAEAGHKVCNLDCTIIAEEPRLEGHLDSMRDAIAHSLKIESSAVSVKATTTDHLGFAGRGEGIAAFAVVLLE